MNITKPMRHALCFARRHAGKWHTYNIKCRTTRIAITELETLGLIYVNEFNQFKIKD